MSMRNYIDDLCEKNPDGVQVAIQFKTGILVQGALRRVAVGEDLFELMGPGQIGDPENPKIPKLVMVSNLFEAGAIERIVLFKDMPQPQIITPKGNGSLIIPT